MTATSERPPDSRTAPSSFWTAPTAFWTAPPTFWTAPTAFWTAPPWPPTPKASGYRIGATHLGVEHWLPNRISAPERARKLGLLGLKSLPDPVFAEVTQSTAAQFIAFEQIRLRAAVADHSSVAMDAEEFTNHPPLVRAALLVPDDLCLLQLDPSRRRYTLIAGVLCSPSYWRLQDKLGAPLRAIHSPVPGLNAELGDRIDHFMQQLPAEGVFQRENFFLHQQQDLFQPDPDRMIYDSASIDRWVIRSECQQFRRLSADLLLFSIAVRIFPWRQIRQFPQAQAALRMHLASFNREQIVNFGGDAKWLRLCELLDAWQSSD